MDKLDFSSIRTVRIHKEQFDAIEKKANSVIIECKEDGRCISFNRSFECFDECEDSESTGSKLGKIACSLEKELRRSELLQLCALITLAMSSDLRKEEKLTT